jgi:hypothetical protein
MTLDLFAARDEYEIGNDYGRGWIVLRPAENGIRLTVCERGIGHDEPSQGTAMRMTFAEAAELSYALSQIVPLETEPTQTRQWDSPLCDACGEPIRSENDRNSGSYFIRGRLGRRVERQGTWHRAHTPKEFYARWGW